MRLREFVLALAAVMVLPCAVRAQDSLQPFMQRARQAELQALIERIRRERLPLAEAELLRQITDSARLRLMAQMLGAAEQARTLQRAYTQLRQYRGSRPAVGNEPIIIVDGEIVEGASAADTMDQRERAIRQRLEAVLDRHLAAEDSLRALEIAEVERRLAQVRSETVRRRRDRAELVRQMVEEVLRDAKRP